MVTHRASQLIVILAAWAWGASVSWAACVTIAAPTIPRHLRQAVAYRVIVDAGQTEVPTDEQGKQVGQSASNAICVTTFDPTTIVTESAMSTSYTNVYQTGETTQQAEATALANRIAAGVEEGQLVWKGGADALFIGDGQSQQGLVPFRPLTMYWWYDEFLGDSNESGEIGQQNWVSTLTGTGTDVTIENGLARRPGIVSLGTGTVASGLAQLNSSDLVIDGGFTWYGAMEIPILSNATEEFDVYLGLFNSGCSSPGVDSLYFRYDRNTSPNWIRTSCAASTCTNTASASAVATGWHRYELRVNASATSAEWLVDGASLGSNTTTLPGLPTSPRLCIVKSAGTTERRVSVDYIAS